MPERTITIAQRCTADEVAAMVAAISAHEGGVPARAIAPVNAAPGPRPPAGIGRAVRRGGVGVLWTRSEASQGRGF